MPESFSANSWLRLTMKSVPLAGTGVEYTELPMLLFGDQLLERAVRCDDRDVAVLVAEVHLAVDHHRRAPDGREHVVSPERLSRS